MDFTNTSAAPAAILKTTFGENHMQAAVVARPSFRIENGRLAPDPEFPWPVALPADVPFLTGAIDFFVMGSLWQPGRRPAPELIAEIRIGQRFLRRIAAIGERRWVRHNGTVVPGYAEPFVSMPITYENAFGGTAETEQGPCPWPPNPLGRGFYFTLERAEGGALPNLEDPDHRIRSIEDRPEPAATGPYPAEGSLRMENAVELDLESDNPGLKRIRPLMFNQAHPRMLLEPSNAPQAGEIVEITHASPDGPLRFPMPDLSFHIEVRLEERSYRFPLHLDRIAVLLDQQRVELGYRVVFKYRLVKGERRSTTLHDGPIPEAANGSAPSA